jgi:putative effector of murein hydrolase LrgA (UPF0299 family)
MKKIEYLFLLFIFVHSCIGIFLILSNHSGWLYVIFRNIFISLLVVCLVRVWSNPYE